MTDKRSAYNLTILFLIIIALFAGLFLTINSLAEEGVEVSTPSNFVLMSSGGTNSTNATSTDGHWNNWNPGNNVWYDSNGIPYYQTVATGEVFHGTNDLLGSPIWAPVAAAGTSDFYGTASANTSSNLLGGSREYYADNFNGDFEADASGLTTSYIDIHDSNFAASKQASVTANNGTVMEMYDNNFNGNTTINAASGGTVNVTLGNTTEMNTLLTYTNDIQLYIKRLYAQFTYYRTSTTQSGAWNAKHTVNGIPDVDVMKIILFNFSFNNTTHQIVRNDAYYFVNFLGFIVSRFDDLFNLLQAMANSIMWQFNTWWDAYRPNKLLTEAQYWIAYNTDTGQYDNVNLATVFGYMTWYLGQLYDDSTNVSQNMQQMTSDIGTAATTFQDLNQKEQVAINQIQQGFETFLPDVTQFQSFRAITWCSNYLQQIYVALGAYGTVIFIALLFGVCLQFIGYFRYK